MSIGFKAVVQREAPTSPKAQINLRDKRMEYERFTAEEMRQVLANMQVFANDLFFAHDKLILIAYQKPDVFNFYQPNTLWWYLPQGTLKPTGLKFPEQIEKCLEDDTCKKELFLKLEDNFLRLGTMDFFGASQEVDQDIARFSLSRKVSHDIWRQIGSYGEWCLISEGVRFSFQSTDEFLGLVANHGSIQDLDFSLTRYDGDRMDLVANDNAAFIYYRSSESKGRFFEESNQAKLSGEVYFARYQGECSVPAQSVIERAKAITLMTDFVQKGAVTWLRSFEK